MVRCSLCPRPVVGVYTVTTLVQQDGQPDVWNRGLAALCSRCHGGLTKAGAEGRRLKKNGERWWLGHGVGLFESKGAPGATARER